MVTPATAFGWRGEAAVRTWLEQRGFVFVAQHYRTHYGEIDLIMRDGKVLVFVEVKTRRSRSFGTPEEAVSQRKLERLWNAAELYLQRRGLTGPVRMDLVTLERRSGRWNVKQIRNIGS